MTSSVLEPPAETPAERSTQSDAAPGPAGFTDIGAVDAFLDGQPTRVEVGGRGLVVVRKGSEFFALRDICPHQRAHLSDGTVSGTPLPCAVGGDIPWGRQGEIVSCPWHGWEFDLRTGRSLADPQRVRVRRFVVKVVAGRVWLDARVRRRSREPEVPPTACPVGG